MTRKIYGPNDLAANGIDVDPQRTAEYPGEGLLTQTEARRLARKLNETRGELFAYTAETFPSDAWGGTERGWVVTLIGVPAGGAAT